MATQASGDRSRHGRDQFQSLGLEGVNISVCFSATRDRISGSGSVAYLQRNEFGTPSTNQVRTIRWSVRVRLTRHSEVVSDGLAAPILQGTEGNRPSLTR